MSKETKKENPRYIAVDNVIVRDPNGLEAYVLPLLYIQSNKKK